MPLSSSYQQFMPLTRSLSFEHLASPGYQLLPQSFGLFGIGIAVFFINVFGGLQKTGIGWIAAPFSS